MQCLRRLVDRHFDGLCGLLHLNWDVVLVAVVVVAGRLKALVGLRGVQCVEVSLVGGGGSSGGEGGGMSGCFNGRKGRI